MFVEVTALIFVVEHSIGRLFVGCRAMMEGTKSSDASHLTFTFWIFSLSTQKYWSHYQWRISSSIRSDLLPMPFRSCLYWYCRYRRRSHSFDCPAGCCWVYSEGVTDHVADVDSIQCRMLLLAVDCIDWCRNQFFSLFCAQRLKIVYLSLQVNCTPGVGRIME